jgi:SAM-dependent methyltransferase
VIDLGALTCLQISDDRCIEPSWFATHAVSIYETKHSLDIQALPIASGAYDCVICNHVLEHVPSDVVAMGELFRIVSDTGFLQIGVPDPIRMKVTEDWGYPRWEDHGHFRKYGIDIVEKFRCVLGAGMLLTVIEEDPVTKMKDIYFILTRSEEVVTSIRGTYPELIVHRGEEKFGPTEKAASAPFLHASPLLRPDSKFDRYVVESGHAQVAGWVLPGALSAITAFNGLQKRLGIKGHVCEIGVHHGRFFIALSLLRSLGEKSVAIDVFDLQEFNVDKSGEGNRAAFDANVNAWLAPDPDVVVVRGDSLKIEPEEIVQSAGGTIRLFSVDGSHTFEHTLNDMRIAERALSEGGLVIVDDFLNPAWPGVVDAITAYLREPDRPTKLVPVCYGDNKFYLTTRGHVADYQSLLSSWPSALERAWKKVSLGGYDLAYLSLPPADTLLKTTPITPGRSISLYGASRETISIVGGSSQPESSGIWLVGHWNGLAFDLDGLETDAAYAVILRLHCFRSAGNPVPAIGIHVFGKHICDCVFDTGNDEKNVTFAIDKHALGASRRLEVWLYSSNVPSPSELGLSNDRRKLAVLLQSVSLKRV